MAKKTTRQATLRLVTDNRHLRRSSKKTVVYSEAIRLKLFADGALKPLAVGKMTPAPPVTDPAGDHSEPLGSPAGAAEGINDLVDGCQDDERFFRHAERYSAFLKKVKSRPSESLSGLEASSLSGMDNAASALGFKTLVGLRLKAGRKAMGKQNKICAALKVSASKWSQWETGQYLPDEQIAARFADRYGISMDWIYRGRADTLPPDRVDRVLAEYEALLEEASTEVEAAAERV